MGAELWHRNIASLIGRREGKRMSQHVSHRASDEIAVLRRALDESVKLQSHYASLLNMHDGGSRLTFDASEAWLRRLEELDLAKS